MESDKRTDPVDAPGTESGRVDQPMTRRRLVAAGGALGITMAAAAYGGGLARAATVGGSAKPSIKGVTISFLAWPGHGDKYLVEPFEKATGARVRVKEYQDGEQALALYSNSPRGTYDVIMTEPTDLQRFVRAKGFERLDPDEFPSTKDFISLYRPNSPRWKDILGGWYNDRWVAVPWSWAVQSMSINNTKVPPKDRRSYSFVWTPRYEGRVGWSIYWLNAMSTMSQYYGMTNGWWKPFEIAPLQLTNAQWKEFRKWMFSRPKENVRGFYGIGNGTQAFAQGEIWAYPGAGFPTTASLQKEKLPFSNKIPKEGSPFYTESLSIGLGSKNVEAAKQFIQYCISPEGCARKATMPAYQGLPVNFKSWRWIKRNQREWIPIMDINPDGPNVLDSVKKGILSPRILPENVNLWVKTYEQYKNTVG
jgi:spermidine/putrescine transport system substrate-binding protein